jgi:hypothetical protein
LAYSTNGFNWIEKFLSGTLLGVSWANELSLFFVSGNNQLYTSSFKNRQPTNHNIFDSEFNSINENGEWAFKSLTATTIKGTNLKYGDDIDVEDALNGKQATIMEGSLSIDKTSGLQDALNSTAKLVSGLNLQSFTGNQRIIGDLEVTSLITASEFVAIELTPTINGSLTTKSYVDTQVALKPNLITDGSLSIDKTSGLQDALNAKQATITDGSLSIDRTSGLQDALNAKQATITTSSNLIFNSLTTNHLEVDNIISTSKFFDTIVVRRPTGIPSSGNLRVGVKEIQCWVDGVNIMLDNGLKSYFASFLNKEVDIGSQNVGTPSTLAYNNIINDEGALSNSGDINNALIIKNIP